MLVKCEIILVVVIIYNYLFQDENVQDDVQAALIKIRYQQVSQIPESKMKELKKRKLIRTQ